MVRSGYTALADLPTSTRIHSWWVKAKDLSRVLVFAMGLCSGVMFSITFFSALRQTRVTLSLSGDEISYELQSERAVHLKGIEVRGQTHSMDEEFHKGESVIANRLKREVRVLCLVMTSKVSWKSAEAVNNTWGPRCNTLLFISNYEDSELPVLRLHQDSSKLMGWGLMKAALRHVYIHHLATHDWVLRADDDTFVVVENLRYLLTEYKPSDPLYLGCRYKKYVSQGFMSGGAGYVLSKEAVSRFVRDGLTKQICREADDGTEDVEMGRCMERLNVPAVDTRDSLGRERFFPFPPENHLIPNSIPNSSWYWDMTYYPPLVGYNCCSDTTVSFHGIGAFRMYVINYLVYHLRAYGLSPHAPLNKTNIYIVIK